MKPTLEMWTGLLATLALEVAVLVGLALAVQRWVRSAQWARAVGQACFVAVLLITAGDLVAARSFLKTWLAAPPPPPPAIETSVVVMSNMAVVEEAPPLSAPVTHRPLPPPADPIWWPGILWLLGFAGILGRWLVLRCGFIWLRWRRQRIVGAPDVLERVQRLAWRQGLRRRIIVLEMEGLNGPIAFGLFRSAIGLPVDFSRRFAPAQLEVMLAHELAHLAGRDPLWHAIADFATALLWWHPFVWFARRRLRSVNETVADEASLLVENGPDVLAKCLVELAKRLTDPQSFVGLGIEGSEFRSGLGQRVKRLVVLGDKEWKPPMRMPNWLPHVIGPTTAVALLLGVAVWCQWDESAATDLPGAFRSSVLGLTMAAVFPSQPSAPADASGGSAPAAMTRDETTEEKIPWQPWSAEAVTAARAAGDPVLVEFTADWSVTAQVNEQTSLEIPAVRAKLRELGFVALRGDNTVEDALITAQLRKFERSSVPLVVVYGAAPDALPMVLPEVLTPQIVLDALDRIGSAGTGPPASDSRIPEQKDPKNNAPKLILEGKALLQAGKFAEAESRLQEALKLDPSSTAAKHYLAEVQVRRERASKGIRQSSLAERSVEAKSTTNVTRLDSRRLLSQKLDSVVFDEVTYDGIALLQVAHSLARETRARDSEGRGVNFIVDNLVTNVTVNIRAALRKVTLRQTLDAVVRCAEQPLKYGIEDYGVVLSSRTADAPPLHTRWFKIDANTLASAVSQTRVFDFAPSRAASPQSGQGHYRGVTLKTGAATNSIPSWVDRLKELLTRAGVDLTPPKEMLFNDRLGMLMVRATLADLDVVQQTIQFLNMSPPQIAIEVKFCELTEEANKKLGFDWMLGGVARSQAFQSLTDTSALDLIDERNADSATVTNILTEQQYRVVLRVLEQQRGVNVLTSPKVTTLSGRQAQIKAVEVRYVVTRTEYSSNDVPETLNGSRSDKQSVQPIAETFELGPVIDVVPRVLADGVTVSMTVIPMIREFLGYDLESAHKIQQLYKAGDPKAAPAQQLVPLPIFRIRKMSASANVSDGQTLVLFGGSMTYDSSETPPSHRTSTSKGAAQLFGREKPARQRKSLLVFVTPTIIDPAGNRVNPPDKMPFRQNAIPPQPRPERGTP